MSESTPVVVRKYWLRVTRLLGARKPLYSTDDGFAVLNDNDFGDGENAAEQGISTSVPYEYSLFGSVTFKAATVGTAGNILSI